jgi:GNAT superfamily N-acetyltransferase
MQHEQNQGDRIRVIDDVAALFTWEDKMEKLGGRKRGPSVVRYIFVHRAYRRKGIGRLLAKDCPLPSSMFIPGDNHTALAFWKAIGAQVTGKRADGSLVAWLGHD